MSETECSECGFKFHIGADEIKASALYQQLEAKLELANAEIETYKGILRRVEINQSDLESENTSLEIKLRICNDRSLRTYDGLTDKADRADALEAENAKLKEDNDLLKAALKTQNTLNDSAFAENATLKAKLEKCKEQRNFWISLNKQDNCYIYMLISREDAEISQIIAVDNKEFLLEDEKGEL
jgi:chromosome segregation ATPase